MAKFIPWKIGLAQGALRLQDDGDADLDAVLDRMRTDLNFAPFRSAFCRAAEPARFAAKRTLGGAENLAAWAAEIHSKGFTLSETDDLLHELFPDDSPTEYYDSLLKKLCCLHPGVQAALSRLVEALQAITGSPAKDCEKAALEALADELMEADVSTPLNSIDLSALRVHGLDQKVRLHLAKSKHPETRRF